MVEEEVEEVEEVGEVGEEVEVVVVVEELGGARWGCLLAGWRPRRMTAGAVMQRHTRRPGCGAPHPL